MFSLKCLSFIRVDVSGRWLDLGVCGEKVWAGDWGPQLMEFRVSSMDEIIRIWMLIEKQPEDQALRLSSIMGFIEQEVPKRRLRGSKQFGGSGSSLVNFSGASYAS